MREDIVRKTVKNIYQLFTKNWQKLTKKNDKHIKIYIWFTEIQYIDRRCFEKSRHSNIQFAHLMSCWQPCCWIQRPGACSYVCLSSNSVFLATCFCHDLMQFSITIWVMKKNLTLKYLFCTSDVLLNNTSFAADSNILIITCAGTSFSIPFPNSGVENTFLSVPTTHFKFQVYLFVHIVNPNLAKNVPKTWLNSIPTEVFLMWKSHIAQYIRTTHQSLRASLIVRSSSSRCLNKPTTMSADTHGWVFAPKNTEWSQIAKRPKCPGYLVHSQKWPCIYIYIYHCRI